MTSKVVLLREMLNTERKPSGKMRGKEKERRRSETTKPMNPNKRSGMI